jgi:hypothetical protein
MREFIRIDVQMAVWAVHILYDAEDISDFEFKVACRCEYSKKQQDAATPLRRLR